MTNGNNQFPQTIVDAITLPLGELQRGLNNFHQFNMQGLTNVESQIKAFASGAPQAPLFPPLPGVTPAPAPTPAPTPTPAQFPTVTPVPVTQLPGVVGAKKLQLEVL